MADRSLYYDMSSTLVEVFDCLVGRRLPAFYCPNYLGYL